jgi:Ca2+-binding RTX toxin-like protein
MRRPGMKATGRVLAVLGAVATLIAGSLSGSSIAGDPCSVPGPDKVGTAGNNTLRGTPRDDYIHGRGGNDTIIGRGGDDVLCGDGGHDVLKGGRGGDTVAGDVGNDQLYGLKGPDTINGNEGNDNSYGGPGADEAIDLSGLDNLYLGDGPDSGDVFDFSGGDYVNGGQDQDACAWDNEDDGENCEPS